jgi:putative oxidoreductase
VRGRLQNGSLLLGRLLLAACFIPSGLAKLSNISGFALSLAAAGVPSPGTVATGCVLANVFGPLALACGIAPRTTAAALIAVTAATTGLLDRFWELDGMLRKAEQATFLAHLGIIAGLLFYLVSGPGAWSWEGWWRGALEGRAAPGRKQSPRAQAA